MVRLLEWKAQLNCVKHEWSDIKSSLSTWGSVWLNYYLLLTFIISIYNIIKKCDTIKGEEWSYKKTRKVRGNDGSFDGKDV
jgi:hypothetical protein